MEFKIGVIAILLLLCHTVYCGRTQHMVIITDDNAEVDVDVDVAEAPTEDLASSNSYQVIQFPMLDLLSNDQKPPSLKITNRGNTDFNSGSTRFRQRYGGKRRQSTMTIKSPQQPDPVVPEYISNAIDAMLQDPPPYNETARMARYVVTNSNWTSMSTISTRNPTIGYPFSNIVSISDGPIGNSTGVPYFYLTPLDLTVIDLKVNNRASISMTLAQGDYCRSKHYDTEDPRCARVILTGKIVKIPSGSQEEKIAKTALFSRHAGMSGWPKDHGFFCAKMLVSNILLLDYFGGARTIPTDEYYSSSPY